MNASIAHSRRHRFAAVACPPEKLGSLELQLAQSLSATAGAAQRARILALLTGAEPRIPTGATQGELTRLRAAVR